MLAKKHILITGATSLIGHYLLPELLQADWSVSALSRNPQPALTGVNWYQVSEPTLESLDLAPAAALIHLAPLWLLPKMLPAIASLGVKRIIAFSSTSGMTKQLSLDPKEQQIAQNLLAAEQELKLACDAHAIAWTIFRPTLIYGDYQPQQEFLLGKALGTVCHFLKRFGYFPLVGGGRGLRQPVHAEDLAKACLAALASPASYQQSYNLSGGEIISYRTMITRLYQTLGKPARFIPVPLRLLQGVLTVLHWIPKLNFLSPEMATRINQDLCFDHQTATQDFGYQPREFMQR